MQKRIAAFLLAVCMGLLLVGCDPGYELTEPVMTAVSSQTEQNLTTETEQPTTETVTESETEAVTETETEPETLSPPVTAVPPEDEPLLPSVEKDGSYTSPEDVAEYIHTFGTLPANFITKKEAQALGWVSSEGNLQDVAPGMSIGGDYFGNREGLLPEGSYHECDVNYTGGYRGSERLIYGADGSIYYTNDHYQTFSQLY